MDNHKEPGVTSGEGGSQETQSEQAKFEEWAELTQAQKHGAQHDVTGWYYFDEVTQDRWEAWQARAALTRQAAPEAPTKGGAELPQDSSRADEEWFFHPNDD